MPRPIKPFTRAQTLQNAGFLRELARTGNAHDAARSLGVCRATFTGRRRHHPDFAAAWDAALAIAAARLDQPDRAPAGEGRLTRLKSGRVQLRRQPAWRVSAERRQAFLAALSATANVTLSAAAAGISKPSIYNRRRVDPGFAREMRLALETGYRRLEEALLEGWMPEAHADDGWRHNDLPPIPPMSAEQALHLLTLHRKTVEGLGDPLPKRRRESWDEWSLRAALMAEQRLGREREKFRVAEAAQRERGEPAMGEASPVLPALDQVTGWSRAKPIRAATSPLGRRRGGDE